MLKRRQAEYPRENHRTTIVHFANSAEDQIEELAELGVIVSANPYYVTGFGERFSDVGLGAERAHAMTRLGPVEDAGISISIHSDMPIAPADPLFLAWSAVTRESLSGNRCFASNYNRRCLFMGHGRQAWEYCGWESRQLYDSWREPLRC